MEFIIFAQTAMNSLRNSSILGSTESWNSLDTLRNSFDKVEHSALLRTAWTRVGVRMTEVLKLPKSCTLDCSSHFTLRSLARSCFTLFRKWYFVECPCLHMSGNLLKAVFSSEKLPFWISKPSGIWDPPFTDLADLADELSGPTQGPLPSHPGMKYDARRP